LSLAGFGDIILNPKNPKHKEAQVSRYGMELAEGTEIFAGIDLHERTWTVTVRTREVELFTKGIPGKWLMLRGILERYKGSKIRAVYEAGCFGYWLYDELRANGVSCIVTPPSLVPQEHGNKVKTDRRDSRKLACLLAKGLLKGIWVPMEEDRYHRTVIRRRHQIIQERVRIQHRITSELRVYGIKLPEEVSKWSTAYVSNLKSIRFRDHFMQESFNRLLREYDFFCEELEAQTRLVKELSETGKYRKHVDILCSIPGVGVITAMEFLLEIQDVSRFERADQLAAYVGLTPCQYSSGDKVRMGRITKIGKNHLRALLIEASWQIIKKDSQKRARYENIKMRAGGKRAIVGIARRLILTMRRMLLNTRTYREMKDAKKAA